MSDWEVFRWDDSNEDELAWVPVGNYYGYLGYPPDVCREIGERHGAGSYLFLNAETKRYETLAIGARQEFYEVPEEPSEEPEPMSAEQVVEATGGVLLAEAEQRAPRA